MYLGLFSMKRGGERVIFATGGEGEGNFLADEWSVLIAGSGEGRVVKLLPAQASMTQFIIQR